MGGSRQCLGKQPHKTRASARAQANSMRYHQMASRMSVYCCTYCGFWHVGHPKRNEQTA